jgi:hypothetical protein
MGGSSSKQPTVVRPQPPPPQNFIHSLPTNRSVAWNPGVNNQPTALARGLNVTVRETSQRNLPSQSHQISELSTLSTPTRRIAPLPPLEQKSNNSAPVLIQRQLPPRQVPANTTHVGPLFGQPATSKPSEPKPRATVSPLHNAKYLELAAKMVTEQQTTLVAATSTSLSSPLATLPTQAVVLSGAKSVKRLRNSKSVGTPPARRPSLSTENSTGVASAGRRPMPPLNQGKIFC